MSKKKFDGASFKDTDFSPEERAQLRHMWVDMSENFVEISPGTVEKIEAFAGILTAAQNLSKVIGVAGILGAAIAIWFKIDGGI